MAKEVSGDQEDHFEEQYGNTAPDEKGPAGGRADFQDDLGVYIFNCIGKSRYLRRDLQGLYSIITPTTKIHCPTNRFIHFAGLGVILL